MPLSKTKLTVVGAAGLGAFGIVAAALQWWAVALAIVIVLQVAVVALVVLRRSTADLAKTQKADLAKTQKSVSRIERQLKSTSARSAAVDEQIRADIADRLAELTELARAWDTSESDAEPMATRRR